jgi:hypothetical protein
LSTYKVKIEVFFRELMKTFFTVFAVAVTARYSNYVIVGVISKLMKIPASLNRDLQGEIQAKLMRSTSM